MSNFRGSALSAAAALLLFPASKLPQDAASSPAGQGNQQTPASTPASQPQDPNHKHTPFDDFLIRGTVFTDKALAFPGVQLRVRRVGEKKFRWQDLSNSRGNFALRVPYGSSYEVFTHAKGFRDQSRTIEAKKGLTEENLAFKMESIGGKK